MIKHRSGKAGIIASVILMFSISLFMGSLLWLVTDAGFLFGAPGTSLFKPAVLEETPITLNQTIKRLNQNGCMIVYYSKEYTSGYERVSFDNFIQAAISEKIVYRVDSSENGTVFLVVTKGKTLEWLPKG